MRLIAVIVALLLPVSALAQTYANPKIMPTGGNAAVGLADRAGKQLMPTDFTGTNTVKMNSALLQVLANGGGTLRVPGSFGSFTFTAPDPSVVVMFDGPNINSTMAGLPGGAVTDSGMAFSGVLGTARPSSNNRAGVSDFFLSQGSGANGANHGDFSHSFQLYKQNYSCTTARHAAAACSTVALQGENDTLYLSLFQGGPDAASDPGLKSAGGLITGGANCINGIGFCVQTELTTNILDPLTLAIVSAIDIQTGGIDTRVGELSGYGVNYIANIGNQTGAVHVTSAAGAGWGNVIDNAYQGSINFTLSDNGVISFGNPGNLSNEVVLTTTGSLTGRTQSGGLQFQDGNGLIKGSVNKDGSGGFSTGLTDTNSTAWSTSTAYVYGQIATNAGNVYRQSALVGATSSAAPTHTSGCVAGGDTLNWCFIATRTDATLASFSGTGLTVTAPLFVQSAAASPINVPIVAVTGTPNGQVTGPTGGLALRTNGSPARSAYVNEGSGVSNTWNPVLTGSATTSLNSSGTTLATAAAITTRWTVLATVGASTGVILAGTTFPDEQVIINRGANTVNVYPPSSSAQIDALGNGTAATIAASSVHGFYCPSTTQCYTSR